MPIIYCDSAAGGANNGTSWTDAYTTFAAAVAGMGAGDIIYLENNHSESFSANTTFSFPSNASVISVDSGTGNYAKAGSAQLTHSTANNIVLSLTDRLLMRGVYIDAGTDIQVITSNGFYSFYGCVLDHGKVGNGEITFGPEINLTMINCDQTRVNARVTEFILSASSQGARAFVLGGSITCSSASPGALVSMSKGCEVLVQAVSVNINAASEVVRVQSTEETGVVSINDCNFTNSHTLVNGSLLDGHIVRVQNSNYGGSSIKFEESLYQAVRTLDTANYVTAETGDVDGPFSHKVVTNANASESVPYMFKLVSLVADLSTAKTLSVELNSAATLDESDIWMTVVYRGSSANTGYVETDINVVSPSNHAASTVGWTGAGLGGTKQKIELTTTNTGDNQLVDVYIHVAKTSATIHIGTEVTVT